MKKEHLQIIKDAIANLEDIDSKFDTVVSDAIKDIDREIENIGDLLDTLQTECDDLPENQQEGDKGTKLQEFIDSLGEIKSDIEDIKEELEDSPMDDIINKLKEFSHK
jgi:DNA repair exonuclease SbcCD ATPase subunit